jgi:hypothetical protein
MKSRTPCARHSWRRLVSTSTEVSFSASAACRPAPRPTPGGLEGRRGLPAAARLGGVRCVRGSASGGCGARRTRTRGRLRDGRFQRAAPARTARVRRRSVASTRAMIRLPGWATKSPSATPSIATLQSAHADGECSVTWLGSATIWRREPGWPLCPHLRPDCCFGAPLARVRRLARGRQRAVARGPGHLASAPASAPLARPCVSSERALDQRHDRVMPADPRSSTSSRRTLQDSLRSQRSFRPARRRPWSLTSRQRTRSVTGRPVCRRRLNTHPLLPVENAPP